MEARKVAGVALALGVPAVLIGYLAYTGKLQAALGLGGGGGAGAAGGGVQSKTRQAPGGAPGGGGTSPAGATGGDGTQAATAAQTLPAERVPLPAVGSVTYVSQPVDWAAAYTPFQTSPEAAPSIQAPVVSPIGSTVETIPLEQSFASGTQSVWMQVNACGLFGVGGGPWAGMNVGVYPEGGDHTIWGGGTDVDGPYKGQFNVFLPPGRYTVLMSPSTLFTPTGSALGSGYDLSVVQGMVGRTPLQMFKFGGDFAAVNVEVRSGSAAIINLPCY